MSTPIADMVEQMLSTGIPPDTIIAAIRAAEQHAQALVGDGPVTTKRRAYDRERKRLKRAKPSTGIENAVSLSSLPTDSLRMEFEEKKESKEGESENTRARGNSRFDEFWTLYPNKVGKIVAEKSFARALKRATFEQIMDGLRAYVGKTDDRPWCNPATWLNQGRWTDQPATTIGTTNGQHRQNGFGSPRYGFAAFAAHLRESESSGSA